MEPEGAEWGDPVESIGSHVDPTSAEWGPLGLEWGSCGVHWKSCVTGRSRLGVLWNLLEATWMPKGRDGGHVGPNGGPVVSIGNHVDPTSAKWWPEPRGAKWEPCVAHVEPSGATWGSRVAHVATSRTNVQPEGAE